MTPAMIRILLWIPFIFVAAITLPVFCTSGYRRGIWNALVSLAATVLAAIVSVVLARALSARVSRPIIRALEEVLSGSADMGGGMEAMLINSVVCVFMAMGLYVLMMLVLTVLFKYIGKALWAEELQRSDSGMRWGGLMVRLVDGVLYALLLLLPIYGSLGNVLPVLSAMDGLFGEDTQAQQAVVTLENHPVVKASSIGPLKEVYRGLAVVPAENGDISLVEVTESLAGTASRYQAIEEAIESGEMTMDMARDLVDFLREDVLYQPWVYSAYREMLAAVPAQAYEDPAMAQLLELMDMDQKTFVSNMDAILAVAEFALEEGIVEQLVDNPQMDIAILYDSGLMERLGELINSSDEAVGLRDLLIRESVDSLCRGDEAVFRRLMASYSSVMHRDEAGRLGDAEALLLLADGISGNARLNTFEALLRLGFDPEVLREVFMDDASNAMQDYLWADRKYIEEVQSQLQEKYGKKLSVKELVWQEVLAAAQLPLEEYPRFDRNVPDASGSVYDRVEIP